MPCSPARYIELLLVKCPEHFPSFVVSLIRTKGLTRKKAKNMSTQRKTKTKKGKAGRTPASIVWFEIPADNVERAKKFYGALFGWKIEKFPGQMEYWHID